MSELHHWAIEPVYHIDGSEWLGLAYIFDGENVYGSLNEQQAIAIVTAHNKLLLEFEKLQRDYEDRDNGA